MADHEFDGAAREIVFAHLSQRANEPHLARLMAETALQMRTRIFPRGDENYDFISQTTDRLDRVLILDFRFPDYFNLFG